MFFPSESKTRNFEDHVLIVPAVSVGNVAQLTADVLISTLFMKRIGFIQHDAILPLVGGDPFAHPDATACKIVTSCEVYESIEHNLLVIQQRAPFVKGKRPSFRKWLVDWIKENKFKTVVILTSSFAHERLDMQLEGPQFRYIASPHISRSFGEEFSKLYKWQELEARCTFPAPTPTEVGNGDSRGIYIPGGGIAKTLYEDICDDIPTAVLLMFCSEGDNAQEALTLANHLNQWLMLVDFKADLSQETSGQAVQKPTGWKIPISWKLFYGARVEPTLFH